MTFTETWLVLALACLYALSVAYGSAWLVEQYEVRRQRRHKAVWSQGPWRL